MHDHAHHAPPGHKAARPPFSSIALAAGDRMAAAAVAAAGLWLVTAWALDWLA